MLLDNELISPFYRHRLNEYGIKRKLKNFF